MEKEKIKKVTIWVLLILPLVVVGFWIINLLVKYFTPAPDGVMQAPLPAGTLVASGTFLVGYSIFLALFALKEKKE